MSEDCGKITFITGAKYSYTYTRSIPDTSITIWQYNLEIPYPCGSSCVEKACISWNPNICADTCKIWGIPYCCKFGICEEEICVVWKPKWCYEKVPLWPETKLTLTDETVLYIDYTTNTLDASLLKAVNNLGELTFGFTSGKLKLKIEGENVLKLNMTRYKAVITTSGAINFYYEAYVFKYNWEGLEQIYTVSPGIQFCPYLLTVSILLKCEVETTYYGVYYKAKQEVVMPLPL
jgi:hypothetical protein